MKTKAGKWVVYFFVGMVGITIVSRIINNACLIKVEITHSAPRDITKKIEGSGQVKGKNEELMISAENILVTQVNVKPGEEVEAGTVLYQLDVNDIQNKISEINDEIIVLNMQNEEIYTQQNIDNQHSSLEYQHRVENYNAAIVNKNSHMEEYQNEIDSLNVQKEMLSLQIQTKTLQYEEAIRMGDVTTSENLLNEIENNQEEIDIIIQKIDDIEKLYTQTKETDSEAICAARQGMESAGISTAQSTIIEQNQITIDQKNKEIEKLNELGKTGNVMVSYQAVIEEVFVSAGMRTTDGADMIVMEKGKDVEVEGNFPDENSELLQLGTMVKIEDSSKDGKVEMEFPITSIRVADNDSDIVEVKINIPNTNIRVGSRVDMSVDAETTSFPTVIEREALYLDSKENYYVYILKEEETMLGKGWKVSKREVLILDKNQEYVAVSGISNQEEVVLKSSRYIEDGVRVKKVNE